MVTVISWMLVGAALAAPKDRELQKEDCRNGVATECTALGLRYKKGDGAPNDATYALKMFNEGCTKGDPEACVLMADAYRIGDGVARDPARALEIYTDGCAQRIGKACRALGEVYVLGDGVRRDSAASGIWYEQGCLNNDAESCVGAAMGMERGDVVYDPAIGRELLTKACNLEHARGCTLLAERYASGLDGATKSEDLAFAMYQLGCQYEGAEACYEVGLMALKGKGMPASRESAKLYLTDACEWNNYNACRELADVLRDDDPSMAVKAAARGCTLGDKPSCRKAKSLGWRDPRGG